MTVPTIQSVQETWSVRNRPTVSTRAKASNDPPMAAMVMSEMMLDASVPFGSTPKDSWKDLKRTYEVSRHTGSAENQ